MIVEDDATIASLLGENLKKWGFDSVCASDFDRITAEFESCKPHLVLMDISLPFFNGYYWCSEIRKLSNVPIVFLSSRTDNMDIVMAMNMGGDDYITKPFSLDILIAKIQAILRRTYALSAETSGISGTGMSGRGARDSGQSLEVRGAILDLNTTDLLYDNEKIELTKNEFKILQLLIEQKNRVITREQIMKRLWDSDSFIDDNTLTVNINRLRKKLEDAGIADLIATKKGTGYMIYD
jgi:DNA-binding response OmpR family regulator